MGALLGVLAVIGVAVIGLPRVLRRPSAADGAADDGQRGLKPGTKPASLPRGDESPSRRFAAVSQRVGDGGAVPPEPLREGKGWQPEMGENFHQTTAYPEAPVAYEEAEERRKSGTHPVATPSSNARPDKSLRSS